MFVVVYHKLEVAGPLLLISLPMALLGIKIEISMEDEE